MKTRTPATRRRQPGEENAVASAAGICVAQRGQRYRRIAVVGTTGSGKTRLARTLSERLALAHIELDALFWEPDWKPAPTEVFRRRVQDALRVERWVADGNYSFTRDLVWTQADTLIWLDYPLPLVEWQLLVRSLRDLVRRELLWGTNRPTVTGTFFARDSLFAWAAKTYRRRRRQYPELFTQEAYAHLEVHRFRSRSGTTRWLSRVSSPLPAV